MGKKPFSAKAKREQLQRKRAAASAAPAAATSASRKPNSQLRSRTPSASRYRLVLDRSESDNAREEARALAHVPVPVAPLRPPCMHVYDIRPKGSCPVPQRPAWTYDDSVANVDARETAALRSWIKDVEKTANSYFERNLETWRQLWRVLERSDVLVLVLDVRFPALHFVPDLYQQVMECPGKGLVLALNKCDLVSKSVLAAWRAYFRDHFPELAVAMFSSFPDAKLAPCEANSELLSKRERRMAKSKLAAWGADQLLEAVFSLTLPPQKKRYLSEWRERIRLQQGEFSEDEAPYLEQDLLLSEQQTTLGRNHETPQSTSTLSDVFDYVEPVPPGMELDSNDENLARFGIDDVFVSEKRERGSKKQRRRRRKARQQLYDTENLSGNANNEKVVASGPAESSDFSIPNIEGTSEIAESDEDCVRDSMITIGMIGHPNTGKSSMINGIFRRKVVSTSRTPGHTKHLQTMFLSENVRLCDCPGIVFPALAPREIQVLAGMYPIAQLKEPYAVVKYLAERVPLVKILDLESELGKLREEKGEDPLGKEGWTAWKICEAFALKRGFRTAKAARLDVYRAANSILRLALDGRIVLSTVPPNFEAAVEEDGGMNKTILGAPWDVLPSLNSASTIAEDASVNEQEISREKSGDSDSDSPDIEEDANEHGGGKQSREGHRSTNAFSVLNLDVESTSNDASDESCSE